MSPIKLLIIALLLANWAPLSAQDERFRSGDTIKQFGKIAKQPGHQALPDGASFKVSFDVVNAAKPGAVNRHLDSAARFINMHTVVGVAPENLDLAVVVHGGAVKDLSHSSHESNVALVKALHEFGVKFYVCGQSAAYHGVDKNDLLPGVQMSLSAMTAHALLQQQGYTLNPF